MEEQEKGKFEITFSCLFGAVSLLMKHLRSFLALGIFFIPFNIATHLKIENNKGLENSYNTPFIMLFITIIISISMIFFITNIMIAERGGKLFINEIKNDIKQHFFPVLKASILMFLYIAGGAILIAVPIAILAGLLSPSLALILLPIILVYVIVMSLRYMFIIYFTIFYKQPFKQAKDNSIMLIDGYKFPAFIALLVLGIIQQLPIFFLGLAIDPNSMALVLATLTAIILYPFQIVSLLTVYMLWKNNLKKLKPVS